MKIYTKKGDLGETSLFGGERVRKDHLRIEAYGTIDELNTVLGLILSENPYETLVPQLIDLQQELFVAGADLATPQKKKSHVVRISQKSITKLEGWIDVMDSELPPLLKFILPSGTKAATLLQFARTVCRRAERNTIKAKSEENEINPLVISYLNRLSDLFFVMSRYENFKKNVSETEWLSGV